MNRKCELIGVGLVFHSVIIPLQLGGWVHGSVETPIGKFQFFCFCFCLKPSLTYLLYFANTLKAVITGCSNYKLSEKRHYLPVIKL
jgi:hypothetical protein